MFTICLGLLFSDLCLYEDDIGLMFQHKDVGTMEQQLSKDLANSSECFIDNEIIIRKS